MLILAVHNMQLGSAIFAASKADHNDDTERPPQTYETT